MVIVQIANNVKQYNIKNITPIFAGKLVDFIEKRFKKQ